MFKKGDTLIEVMLAVGIFSMVAVAVVAVMSNGTAGAQTALETTLAREEIDAQAEALRFIQASYINDKDTGDDRFAKLWESITGDNAIDLTMVGESDYPNILQFSPTDCNALYTKTATPYDDIFEQKAFVINTHKLGKYTTADKSSTSSLLSKVIYSANSQSSYFAEASTYPRLIFGASSSSNSDKDALAAGAREDLWKAEGIYIIAVKDKETTNIVSEDNPDGAKQPAFYDFYIRTCWYGVGDQTPSTISTVIRLYDPRVVSIPDNS